MDRDDEARLRAAADDLADTVEDVLPGWVERCVRRFLPDADPGPVAEAAARAVHDVVPRLRALLAKDVDEQRANPLAILRTSVRYPTELLAAAGVPPVERADFDVRAFPDDPYDLTPATWSDIDPTLQAPGITWGAAKAYVHLSRRR